MAKIKNPTDTETLRKRFSGWDELSPQQQARLLRLLSEPEPDWDEAETPAEVRHDTLEDIVQKAGLEVLEAGDAGEMIALAKAVTGISQRALAERVGVSNPRVAQVQQAGWAIEVQTLERFARALGYDLELRFVPVEENHPVIIARAK